MINSKTIFFSNLRLRSFDYFLCSIQMKDYCPEDKVSIMIIFFVIFSILYIFITIFNTKNLKNVNGKLNNVIFPDEITVYKDTNGHTINNQLYISGIVIMVITILYTLYMFYNYRFTWLSTVLYLLASVYLLVYGIIIIHFQDHEKTTEDFTFLGAMCIIASVLGLYYKILDTLVCS